MSSNKREFIALTNIHSDGITFCSNEVFVFREKESNENKQDYISVGGDALDTRFLTLNRKDKTFEIGVGELKGNYINI